MLARASATLGRDYDTESKNSPSYVVWSGRINRLSFGENENGLSDPSVLTEMYDWSLINVVNRYCEFAHACLTLLVMASWADYFLTLTFSASPRACCACIDEHDARSSLLISASRAVSHT